ncbi:MAG TPA: RNA polymerase sigma factor [Solirubrobacteraceae bacterium]|nr:RNA polymerase sigma factor [Solirubrobacteraceae bacterium]
MSVWDGAELQGLDADADSFAAFYRRFERPVLGFFMRCVGRQDLAADLMAETFARALEGLDSYDPARGRADQWLFGIARHVLASSLRGGRVETQARARLGLPALVLDDHACEVIERLSCDVRVLEALPAEQRDAVRARVIEERSYSEIASELECSEALVRQRVSRGLRTLRVRLAGQR